MQRFISIILISVLLVTVALLPACAKVGSSLNGSGKIVDQDIDVTDFNSVNAKGQFQLKIAQADESRVTLSTDDNLVSRVIIVLDRKTLKLSIEAPSTFFPTSLTITIAMPQLIGLNLSGGASATLSGFKSPHPFSLFMADKSTLDGDIDAGSINFNLSGTSTAVLKGGAASMDLTAIDTSKLDLSSFTLLRAKVNLDQSSEAIVNVSGQFDVTLNNKSKIFFLGNPIFTNTYVANGSSMSMVQPK